MCRAPSISPPVSVRLLLGLLIAMAMAFAPFAMPIGDAMAAQPSHHGEMAGMAKGDHCPDEQQPQKQSHKGEKSCCVAGCFALATLSEPETGDDVVSSSLDRPAPQSFRRSVLSEIATPPPRLS